MISQRTMRNESGEILRRVAGGESFIVTNDGVPVGVLSPYEEDTLTRLRRQGLLTPDPGPFDPSTLPEPVELSGGVSASDLLIAERRRR